MALNKWILFAIFFVVTWVLLAPFLGITGGLLHVLLLSLAIAAGLSYFGIIKVFPFPLKKTWLGLITIAILGFFALEYGWLTGLMPGAIPGVPAVPGVPAGPCVVTDELRGKDVSVSFNAWDLESNTPYSAPVDFATGCYVYKNGNAGRNYVNTTTATNGAAMTGKFTAGDTIYVYCGGTTYYGDAVEAQCLDSQSETIDIDAHTIVGESDMQITGYDDTGSTALDAAGDSTMCDYNLTLAENEEKAIYIKLKTNVANKAYQFCGWGTVTLYNISSVEPQDVEASYTEIATPLHLSSIDISYNTTAETQSRSYTLYKTSAPILMREWDSIKEQFEVTAHTTNDPLDRQIVGAGAGKAEDLNGFAIIAKDCAYARGDDGKTYLDVYQHDTAEADVGLDETDTSPAGKQVGVQVCAK